MILRRTTAMCSLCGVSHPAEVVRSGGEVVGIVHCPSGERRHRLSTDAAMYDRLTRSCGLDAASEPPDDLRFAVGYIPITNVCNFRCKVCIADANGNGGRPVFIGAADICRRAEHVRKVGGPFVQLMGGEPTMHPGLPEIVGRLTSMGFCVGISTNGYRMGVEPLLARRLRRKGLARVCIQFDSLSERTLCAIARPYLMEKMRAVRNAVAAGLRVGLNCTVTEENLEEVDAVMSYGLDLGPRMWNVTFGSAAPMGRYMIGGGDSPDREAVVSRLLRVGKRYRFSLDDFTPLPCFRPWGLQVHPDCGVHIVFVRTPWGVRPLNRYVDLHGLHRRMMAARARRGFPGSLLLPALLVLRSMRVRRLPSCVAIATGLLLLRSRFAVMNVAVTNYRAAMFLDEQRLRRCSGAVCTSIGPVRGCLHYFMGPMYPGSHGWETRAGSC